MPRLRMGALCGGALGLLVAACLEPPRYTCMTNAECVLNNVQGMCDTGLSTCLYISLVCPSGYSDGHGTCVIPTALPTTSTTEMTSLSVGSDEDSGSSSGGSSSGESSWGTTFTPVECDGMGGADPITADGSVSASTEVLGMYTAELAVDNDPATSWFSTGPEPGGMPTVFRWTPVFERCVFGIVITGNEDHPERSDGWGFESVTVKVLDVQSNIVFQRTEQLDGSPDPLTAVMTEGVVGDRVLLEFSGHENPLGGGFSELVVLGQ